MVRSPSNRSPSRGIRSRETRNRSPRSRPPRARSPRRRSIERRKSPVRRASPRRRSPNRRRNARQGRFSGRGAGNAPGRGRGKGGGGGGGNAGLGNRRRRRVGKNKYGKWRNKNRQRGGPPVSGGNRQPIASMRMRMDDYLPPRADRLLPLGKGADIDHAVARARREASTRTKDTFWTKKLLDAEATHPNRSRSPRQIARRRHKTDSSISRSKSPRIRRSRSKSPNKNKKQLNSSGKLTKDKVSRHSKGRSYSRSLSSSSSSSTFSSLTSYSRSYSSYSRSSSSSFSSSTTSSLSFRRSYSRSPRAYSRSPINRRHSPPPPQLPKIKTASLSKAVQSVHINRISHQESKKKVVTKTVRNSIKIKNTASANPEPKLRTKFKDEFAPKKPRQTDPKPRVNDSFIEHEVVNKSPQYASPTKTTHVPSNEMNFDKFYKNPPPSTYHRTLINQKKVPHSGEEESESDSSSDDEDGPRKMSLSERFGKLAQLSSQRQEYEGVRMKIVREGGQDKKVYLEGGAGSRTPSPLGRLHRHHAHERWLREHKAEYDEYQQRYGEFRHWDPHRDLPRELPLNWDDINVRYRYYKESGYFGDRAVTMEDYLKWEEWWYRYRDWLEKYGGMQDMEFGGPYGYEGGHITAIRWPSRRGSPRDKEDRKRRRY